MLRESIRKSTKNRRKTSIFLRRGSAPSNKMDLPLEYRLRYPLEDL